MGPIIFSLNSLIKVYAFSPQPTEIPCDHSSLFGLFAAIFIIYFSDY